ncbi:Pathogenicity locus [Oceanobacillus limi]|uniref:Pathogenicity locus n=1 Tax=Oceanobacillus limi TaxID=930131 RepID=A0A1I0CI00_9BACI|nr:helix-hairpin-helix domain-containing protein [Oceanobacillus limi]SET18596.1 Pathogenicity locus [Oceanobacillus limi]
MGSNPKLPLTEVEKTKLRIAKVRLQEIKLLSLEELVHLLDISPERARLLKGLAEFQGVPSIGYQLAEKLVCNLNIYSLDEIRGEEAGRLFDQLEQQLGVWTDSCVEDQLRCVINYANNPTSNKQWYHFTDERKAYRERVGYPANRPQKAWYE